MRADRLVAVLLVLQRRERITASQLAEELEVSVKTARRDLEALSVAGVPVYAQTGRGGGWSLLGGGRTDLSGLTAGEVRDLFLVAGTSTAIAPNIRNALRKLLGALPSTLRDDAEKAASAVVLDQAQWGRPAHRPDGTVEALQRAVIERRQVAINYSDAGGAKSERRVHPLGLVQKAGSWYLVADTADGMRTFRATRIQSAVVTDEPASIPEGFDLGKVWRSQVDALEHQRRLFRAVVRTSPAVAAPLRSQFGADLNVLDSTPEAVTVEIMAATPRHLAERLAGWGNLVEVVEPDEARAELRRIGKELSTLYRRRPAHK